MLYDIEFRRKEHITVSVNESGFAAQAYGSVVARKVVSPFKLRWDNHFATGVLETHELLRWWSFFCHINVLCLRFNLSCHRAMGRASLVMVSLVEGPEDFSGRAIFCRNS